MHLEVINLLPNFATGYAYSFGTVISIGMKNIERIWLTDTAIWIKTTDGREACEYFANYPRLRNATKQQREHFMTDAIGISWPDLDEDLSFDGFFAKKKENALYRLFMDHPELNASAIARRLGISQSLFAQYISGTKKPSSKRLKEIFDAIHQIGQELLTITEVI